MHINLLICGLFQVPFNYSGFINVHRNPEDSELNCHPHKNHKSLSGLILFSEQTLILLVYSFIIVTWQPEERPINKHKFPIASEISLNLTVQKTSCGIHPFFL